MDSPSAERQQAEDESRPSFDSAQDGPPSGIGSQQADAANTQRHSTHGLSEDSDSASSYSDASTSSRPNRFHGPSSTWRAHAAAEIALSASLDQQRAEDLSIHLYNAHHLKRRHRDPERVANAEPWQSKLSWIGRDERGHLPWMPDANWTAWPLSASEVPRPGEGFGGAGEDAGAAVKQKEAWTPSAELEDELLGLMLRSGKEMFRRRRWEGGNGTRGNGLGGEAVKAELSQSAPETDDDIISSTPRPRSRGKPTFLIDDDRARALLGPDIRHILTRLDALLLALHRSRAAQRRPRSVSASRSRSRSRSVVRSGSRAASPDSQAENAWSEAGGEPALPRPRPRRRTSSAGTPRHPLAPRDWSEVLGMAALIGWDPEVVSRAAKRCATLFGEGVVLRSMPETAAGKEKDEVVEYRPGMVAPFGGSDEEMEEEGEEGEVERRLLCPFEGCPRHEVEFAKGFRWREHLKRRHGLGGEQIAALEERLGPRREDVEQAGSAAKPVEVESADQCEGSSEEMEGAVHVDGFLRPFDGKLGRGKDVKERRRRRLTGGEEGGKGKKRVKLEWEESDAVEGADAGSSEEDESGNLHILNIDPSASDTRDISRHFNILQSYTDRPPQRTRRSEMSSEAPGTGTGPAFTAGELRILASAWNCLVEPPRVDYQKLAEACGMSNPRSASNAWANIKKKILAAAQPKAEDEAGEGAKTPKKSPKAGKTTTSRKRVRKVAEDEGDEEGFGAKATKARKKAKAAPKKKGKKDSPVASEAEAEDDIKVKGEEGGAEEDEGDAVA